MLENENWNKIYLYFYQDSNVGKLGGIVQWPDIFCASSESHFFHALSLKRVQNRFLLVNRYSNDIAEENSFISRIGNSLPSKALP